MAENPGPFLVIGENDCCGCVKPVFIGLYATRERAEQAKRYLDDLVIPWTGVDKENWPDEAFL